jgi:hypothetical protein
MNLRAHGAIILIMVQGLPIPIMIVFYYHYSFSCSFPFSVIRYLCRELLGLSGMVISRSPSFIRGFRYLFRNFVQSDQMSASMSSVNFGASMQSVRTFKISFGSSLNLVPTWCRLGTSIFRFRFFFFRDAVWCLWMDWKSCYKIGPVFIRFEVRLYSVSLDESINVYR